MSEPLGSSSDIAQCPASAGMHICQLRCFLHYHVPLPRPTMSHHYVPSSRFDLHIHAIPLLHVKPSISLLPPLLAKPLSMLITLIRLLRHIRTLNGSNFSTLEQPNSPPTALYPTSPCSRVSHSDCHKSLPYANHHPRHHVLSPYSVTTSASC